MTDLYAMRRKLKEQEERISLLCKVLILEAACIVALAITQAFR